VGAVGGLPDHLESPFPTQREREAASVQGWSINEEYTDGVAQGESSGAQRAGPGGDQRSGGAAYRAW
jgi:hypothetical protein